MQNDIDLSTEALLARRAVAEKVMPGAFNGENDYYVREQRGGLEHKWANPPQVVMADIDEILRLRAEAERLNKEADWLASNVRDGECPPIPEEDRCPDWYKIDECRYDCASCWRRAAREAVEKQCQK